jgi:hypothetical protein
MHYILYKITNSVNGKFYIGTHKTKNINDGYFGSGKLLKRAILKYGIDKFSKEILHTFQTEEEMFKAEATVVNERFVERKDTYNVVVGGKGGFSYINANGLAVRNITNKNAKRLSKQAGKALRTKIQTDSEFREKRRKAAQLGSLRRQELYGPAFLGKRHSSVTKQKMSDAKKGKTNGRKNSQYGTMWITDGIANKKILKTEIIPVGWNKGRNI